MRPCFARLTALAAIVLCVCRPALCGDEDSGPRLWTLHLDFEGEEALEGCYTTAAEGVLSLTHDPELVRSGARSLQMTYLPTSGRLALVGIKSLTMQARPRSFGFSLRTSAPSPIMFGVNEADGSSYEGYCYSEGGRWLDVCVDLDELMLATCSTDENDRLDVDEINAVMLCDLSNLSGEVGKSLGIKEGPQTLWLDDVRISTDLAPHRSSRGPEGQIIIYDFEREPPPCLPLGGPELSLTDGPDAEDARALRVRYDKEGYRWVGFVAGVGHLDLSGARHIQLTLRADNQAKLTLVLEERDGSKYSTRLSLDPSKGWHTVPLAFSRFKLDPATEDENSALDLDQLRVIIPVVDSHRAQLDTAGRGSYSISRIWCAR